MVTSRKTGTRRFCTIGLTVVGNPAATVITSSPGLSWRSPSLAEQSADSATRLAEEPELTSDAERTPTKRASLRSNSFAQRPVVNQASRPDSTTAQISSASITLPETCTPEMPGTNAWGAKASAWYCRVSSRICWRSSAAFSVMVRLRIHSKRCLMHAHGYDGQDANRREGLTA